MHTQGQGQQTQQHSTHSLIQQQNQQQSNNAVGKANEHQPLSSVGKRIDYKLIYFNIHKYICMYLWPYIHTSIYIYTNTCTHLRIVFRTRESEYACVSLQV